jgi:hypothetical protein
MLKQYVRRYTGFLRGLKLVYVLNNFVNASRLQRNKALYSRFGLHKSIFSPLGSHDFGGKHDPGIPWIDRPDALENLDQRPGFQLLDKTFQEQIPHFITDGYMVLEHFFNQTQTDALNAEVNAKLESGEAGFNYTGRKIFNLFETSRLANDRFFRNPDILRLLSFLLGKPVIPFQSMNFTMGSEQRAHSDSIHMTSEPQGYLIATWIALEDCTPENGPLFYFPGSHRLPFITTEHYPSGNTFFTIGEESNKRYEDKIAEIIRSENLEKKVFLARRGDVLIWHANLLHGGSAITRPGATRKSMVCHYFAEGVLCYHEISQRPAILPT